MQYLAEVRGAFATGVEALEEMDVRLEGRSFFSGGCIGKACKCGVKELPSGAAEFSFGGLVAKLGCNGMTSEEGSVYGFLMVLVVQ